MLYYEFKEYLEEHATGIEAFAKKALENELEKNKKRSGKAKWNDAKVQKAADDAYKRAITNAYDQIRAKKGVPKYNREQVWIDFMEEVNFIEMFNESVDEVEFEQELINVKRKYYELTSKDIVEAIKLADKEFLRIVNENNSLLDDIHDSWLFQSALRFASMKCKEQAKKKFTPFKYRYQ